MIPRFVQATKQHGFALPLVLAKRLLARFIRLETLVVFCQDLQAHRKVLNRRDPAVRIVNTDSPEAEVFLHLCRKYPHKNFAERLRAGQQCFVAMRDDTIAGYAWATSADIYLDEIACVYAVPADEIFIYDCFVEAESRGAGIYPAMLRAVMADNSRRAKTACIAAAAINRASIRGILKAGFVERKKIRYVECCQRQKWWGCVPREQVSA